MVACVLLRQELPELNQQQYSLYNGRLIETKQMEHLK